jgi:hypothetical protein
VRKGAFIIRGERNYFRDVPLGVAVGLELKGETRVIGGPASAVRAHSDYILEVTPGTFNQNDISKKIYRIYADELGDPRFVKQIASPDQVAMMVPPGESDLKNQRPERKGQGTEPEGREYETSQVENEPEGSEEEAEEEFGDEAGEDIEGEFEGEFEGGFGGEFEGEFEGEIEKKAREEIEGEIEMNGAKKE